MLSRLNALRARHGILQTRIDQEERRPMPDSIRLTGLKKIRLRLREEISALERIIKRSGSRPDPNPAA